jgi:hypothetical protein
MAVLTLTLTDTAQDGASAATSPGTFDPSEVRAGVSLGTTYTCGWRFPGVTIPQGSVINSALFTPNTPSTPSGSAWGSYKLVSSTNAPAWATTTPSNATKLATGAVTVPTGGGSNINLTAALQAIVNQGGWVAGNAAAVVIDPSGANGAFLARDVSQSGGGAATLVIDYTPAVDTTPPTITSTNAISQVEGQALSHTLTANETVTWSKVGGADAAAFTLSGTTLSLPAQTFGAGPFFVTVRATDTSGNTTDQTITVTITEAYAGPLWRSVGVVAAGFTNIQPQLPSGIVAGDRLIMPCESANQDVTISAPWEAIYVHQGTGTAGGTAATRLYGFTTEATGMDMPPMVMSGGDHMICRIHRFDPCDIDAAVGAVQGTATTAGQIPSLTTTTKHCLIVGMITSATDIGTARFSGIANANLGNVTERSDDSTTQGNGGGIGLFTGEKVSAGATGAWSLTLATSSVQGRMAVALRKKSSGPSPISGNLTQTLAAGAASGLAAVAVAASLLAGLTPSDSYGTGSVQASGVAVSPLAPTTADASGTVGPSPITGSLTVALSPTASSGSGGSAVSGVASVSLGPSTAAGAGSSAVAAASAKQLQPVIAVSAGNAAILAAGNPPLAAATGTGSAAVIITGASASALAPTALAATGSSLPSSTGDVSATLTPASTSGSGAASVQGAVSRTLSPAIASAAGVASVSATSAGSLDSSELAGSGLAPLSGFSATDLPSTTAVGQAQAAVTGVGLVALSAGSLSADGMSGDLPPVPDVRHVRLTSRNRQVDIPARARLVDLAGRPHFSVITARVRAVALMGRNRKPTP